jgi:hypothetical protein
LFGDAPLAPGSGSIAQPVEPAGVKGEQPLTDGVLMASEFCSDSTGAESLPTGGDHLGAADPVGGGMTAKSELADLAFFGSIDASGRANNNFGMRDLLSQEIPACIN